MSTSSDSESNAALYERKIQKLENDYRQDYISKKNFIDYLEKYVMRLARANDKVNDDNAQLALQLNFRQSELQFHADKIAGLSKTISEEFFKRVQTEENTAHLITEAAALRIRVSELSDALTKSKESEFQFHADKFAGLSQTISDEFLKRVQAEESAAHVKTEAAALRVHVSELSDALTKSNERRDNHDVVFSDLEKKINQIELINKEKETLKLEEMDEYKITISNLQRNIDVLNIQNIDVMALRSKLRWREAVISNMKDRYEKCKRLSDVRDAKLRNLKRCLHFSHLKCDDLLIESRDRE